MFLPVPTFCSWAPWSFLLPSASVKPSSFRTLAPCVLFQRWATSISSQFLGFAGSARLSWPPRRLCQKWSEFGPTQSALGYSRNRSGLWSTQARGQELRRHQFSPGLGCLALSRLLLIETDGSYPQLFSWEGIWKGIWCSFQRKSCPSGAAWCCRPIHQMKRNRCCLKPCFLLLLPVSVRWPLYAPRLLFRQHRFWTFHSHRVEFWHGWFGFRHLLRLSVE